VSFCIVQLRGRYLDLTEFHYKYLLLFCFFNQFYTFIPFPMPGAWCHLYKHSPPPCPGDPSGGVFHLRIILSPEEASRLWILLNILFLRWGVTFTPYNINWSVFITKIKSVYCAVRTESLYKAVCLFFFKWLTNEVGFKPENLCRIFWKLKAFL
jgi:hypothetical protein